MASAEKKDAAAPEKKEELEENAKPSKEPKIKDPVTFLTPDTTMNVLPSTVGNMLGSLQEGQLGNLVACARASVGVKSGRYMFEAKIVEQQGQKTQFRIGFSAEGSLFLGEDDNSICFDNQGQLISNKKKTKCSQTFGQDTMVAVVLNLDSASPNANTISLFKNGVRVAQPQALPEELTGKTLFPAVSYRGATVHYNFAAPVVPLPFKCKVIGEAVVKESDVTKYEAPAGGKYTVLFPVSLPDEGSFDWLDQFLERNPGYTELSDRALLDWSTKSGMGSQGKPASRDKPDANTNNNGLRNILMQIAAIQPRNFVVMEVKSNLIKEERIAALAKFKNPVFKTVAEVIVAAPPSTFKRLVQEKTLKVKQDLSDAAHKAKHAQEKREWMTKKKQKEMEKAKKKAAKEAAKKQAELKKARELAVKKKQKEIAKKKAEAEGKPVPEDEEEEEKAAEEPEEEEEAEEAEEPEPKEETPPTVTLTAEEKAIKFFKHKIPDLTEYVSNTSFAKFSFPSADEGFGEVKYSWAKDKEAADYLKAYIMGKKATTRVEDIKPSQWFKDKMSSWNSALGQWKNKQNDYKSMLSKKAAEKAQKAAKKAAAEKKAKMDAEKKAKEIEAKKAKGEEVDEAEAAPVAMEEDEPEEPEPEVDFDGVDVFGVEDVCDIGGKTPLFKEFGFEDFAMMTLRAELHFMANSFGKDVDDPDRTGIHLDHLSFYYQKYFNKTLSVQSFGVKTALELVQLVSDTIYVQENSSVFESLIPADLETHAVFAKLTEEARRQRNLAVEMGDASAKLNISRGGGEKRPFEGAQGKPQEQQQGEKRKWEDGKGGGKGKKGKWMGGFGRW